MIGAAKRADFPSPIAVQHKMSSPSRIRTTKSSCHMCRPSSHSGTSSLMILMIVALPSGPATGILESWSLLYAIKVVDT